MPALLLAAMIAGASSVPGPIVIIRMYIAPELPRAFADDAREVATRLLVRAGLGPVWIVCAADEPADPRCALAIDPAEVIVRTLSQPSRHGRDRCGEAYLPNSGNSQMITLFSACSELIARHAPLRAAEVHGYMLVHEIGHLLLGPGHSTAGIMRCPLQLPDWYAAIFGRLAFTPAQLPALRRSAAARWSEPVPAAPAMER